MYKTILFSALILFLSLSETFGQDKGTEKRRFSLSDIYILPGEITQVENTTSVEKYQDFLPLSASIKKVDFADFSDGGSGMGRNISPIFSLIAGFKKSNSQHKSFRIGASIYSNTYVSSYPSSYSDIPQDTITSIQTGEKLYRSKFTYQRYGINTKSVNFRLDAAYIYNFYPDDRISFFSGIGIGSNFSLNAHTYIYYSAQNTIIITQENGNSLSGPESWSWTDMPERINHKGNVGVNVYIPLGIDFQLNEKGLFHKTHLIYEFRPGYNGQFGGMGDFSGIQWEHNIGLKFALK